MSTPQAPVILVVDDCESIRRLLEKILALENYQVHTAESAQEGLSLLESIEPDLILCDVQMPDYDGFYLLEQVRQQSRFELLPFIFISGAAVERQDVRRGMVNGADDYLFKPFSPQELLEAVRVRLERHALFRHQIKPRQARSALTDVLAPYAQLESDLRPLLPGSGQAALITLDIDRFKRLNDALGFQSADQLLHQLLQRLAALKSEQLTLYHGPHAAQVVLLARSLEEPELLALGRQLLKIMAEPVDFQTYQLHLTCSVGIHQLENEQRADEALKKAYIAMNQAKQQGGNTLMRYQQEMDLTATRQLTWENELHQALSHKWFVLHFQPQVDLISGEIQGFEALIRLQHPELGLIFPGEFIPIAEESGLIVPIGDWCLRAACRQIKQWHQQGYDKLRIAVNVSVLQFQKGRLAQRVPEILREHQLDGSYLELELTESALVRDIQSIQADLQQLRDLQVSLAIDDFGTGYSSLSYLRHLPFDMLKIDQSFVRGMADNSASMAIPKAIIDMGHSLGLQILAEGIENQQQMLLLKSYGCDLGQGYYLSKPLPAPEIEALLQQKVSF
ncbi:MAG: EAL domain-containing protein [Candidatus Sericytochromatia bacterium]|nr:EAL domain-containing protein [Candidatus Sericytochromatia bacterium]